MLADKASFTKNNVGRWVLQSCEAGEYRAFVPPLLRSENFDGVIDLELVSLHEKASVELGRLDGVGRQLSQPDSLLYAYVRKEAVLSSQIEGTQSSLADLIFHESDRATAVPLDDVRIVSNYVRALRYGIERLSTLPLSLRLLKELHGMLVEDARGANQSPGEFRRIQNWIGGNSPVDAVFVPPPSNKVLPLLDNLERFCHHTSFPTLLKAGIVHAQFETIHPFLDGNGRVGRMLISFVLMNDGLLSHPWAYFSLYFKRNRDEYYERLQNLRINGDWKSWLRFFLVGVHDVASDATDRIRRLVTLFESDRLRLQTSGNGGSIYATAAEHNDLKVFDHLASTMKTTSAETVAACGISKPTANRALKKLEEMGIAREITGGKRNRIYLYEEYFETLNRDKKSRTEV